MTVRARVSAVVGIVTVIVTVSLGSAGASCIVPPPLHDAVSTAKIAFVGTVVRTSNAGRFASVHVDAVWKGAHVPRRVELRGSTATTENAMTTVDRSYERGQRYLFLPYRRITKTTFLDNACSSTTEYTSAVARAQP